MKPEEKLIVKHAFKNVLCQIEYDRNIQDDLFQIGIEYIKLTEREITEEPDYKELVLKLCELAEL
jgi:hypothetical protein